MLSVVIAWSGLVLARALHVPNRQKESAKQHKHSQFFSSSKSKWVLAELGKSCTLACQSDGCMCDTDAMCAINTKEALVDLVAQLDARAFASLGPSCTPGFPCDDIVYKTGDQCTTQAGNPRISSQASDVVPYLGSTGCFYHDSEKACATTCHGFYDLDVRMCACKSVPEMTCTILEDPHIVNFDGAQVTLLGSTASVHERAIDSDKWLVKSASVSIQARYTQYEQEPGNNAFVRAVAIGGDFLKGSVLLIGSQEDGITWNGKPILQNETSSFIFDGDQISVKANRGQNSSLAQDLSKRNQGVDVDFPMGVKLTVNRLHRHINVAIVMRPQESGQDGLCGNFNGLAADDSLELVSERSGVDVLPEESLFADATFNP